MKYVYQTSGRVCSRQIFLDVEEGIIKSIHFDGGCMGNTQGVANLAVGMKVTDVIERLKGIRCGNRGSSCPAELVVALRQIESRKADVSTEKKVEDTLVKKQETR
ncbi:MAG TPA: TIGR03905 family TSCPD domain-containing protein [Ruminococcaceae bacterium]|nr:TIGR03905 family TSCPD domain-containing protein [Oscillospiraceae bacterium]